MITLSAFSWMNGRLNGISKVWPIGISIKKFANSITYGGKYWLLKMSPYGPFLDYLPAWPIVWVKNCPMWKSCPKITKAVFNWKILYLSQNLPHLPNFAKNIVTGFKKLPKRRYIAQSRPTVVFCFITNKTSRDSKSRPRIFITSSPTLPRFHLGFSSIIFTILDSWTFINAYMEMF